MGRVKVAVDMMGGDVVMGGGKTGSEKFVLPVERAVKGIGKFYESGRKDVEIVAVGRANEIMRAFREQGLEYLVDNDVKIVNAESYFNMDGEIEAGKRKDTSLVRALALHKNNEADGVFSAGNTRNTIEQSLVLGRIELKGRFGMSHKVSFPPLATFMPNKKGEFLLVDAGGSVDVSPKTLYDFAVISAIYFEYTSGRDYTIALLCNGEEASKGDGTMKKALKLMKKNPELKERLFNEGYAEPKHIFNGDVDVVIAEGLIGNIFLKTSEASASVLKYFIERESKKNLLSLMGSFLMKGCFKKIKDKTEPSQYGGAPILGLNGVEYVGHGDGNYRMFCNGIKQIVNHVNSGINEHIIERYSNHSVEEVIKED